MNDKLGEFGIRHVSALRTVVDAAEQIQANQKKIDEAHSAGYEIVNVQVSMLCTVEKAQQMVEGDHKKLRSSVHEVARLELAERGLDPNSFQWHVQLRNTVENIKDDLSTSFPMVNFNARERLH